MVHRFQCSCGAVAGEIARTQWATRAVCYCRDCQAYARVLGQERRVLDASGGTEVVATQSKYVRFTAGTGQLACLSLSPAGLLRWYAKCCRTPIANTPRNWKLPYVGMVHTCLQQPRPLAESFPRVQLRVNTASALGPVPRDNTLGGFLRFGAKVARLAASRLDGSYRQTPFFDGQGAPVTQVTVAPHAAVEQARQATR